MAEKHLPYEVWLRLNSNGAVCLCDRDAPDAKRFVKRDRIDENRDAECAPRVDVAYLTVTGRTDDSIPGQPAGLEDGWWDDCSSNLVGFTKFVRADAELDKIFAATLVEQDNTYNQLTNRMIERHSRAIAQLTAVLNDEQRGRQLLLEIIDDPERLAAFVELRQAAKRCDTHP